MLGGAQVPSDRSDSGGSGHGWGHAPSVGRLEQQVLHKAWELGRLGGAPHRSPSFSSGGQQGGTSTNRGPDQRCRERNEQLHLQHMPCLEHVQQLAELLNRVILPVTGFAV